MKKARSRIPTPWQSIKHSQKVHAREALYNWKRMKTRSMSPKTWEEIEDKDAEVVKEVEVDQEAEVTGMMIKSNFNH